MALDAYFASVGARRLAPAEWGLTISDEHPIDIGIRGSQGLLRIQAFAVPAADAPPSQDVLHWNRTTRLVRFARTLDGDIWVQADVPVEAAGVEMLDRVLGLVVEAVGTARTAAYDEPTRGDRAGVGDAKAWLPRTQG